MGSRQPSPDRPRVRRVRVVLAEDDPDFRLLLRRQLDGDDRFQVVAEAGDGRAAVDEVVRHRPDVVVMDISMPVMDGLAAIRTLREEAPGTKAVVLTAHRADERAQEAQEVGAFAYLEKGTAVRDILTVLAPLAPPEFE